MSNPRVVALVAAVVAGSLVGACRDDPVGPRLIGLECEQLDGSFQDCELILTEAGGFRIDLLSTECNVTGNAVRLLSPTVAEPVLTDDGCVEPPGVLGLFEGPYPAGTAVSIRIESARAGSTSALRAMGEYPLWRVEFEDGTDNDFDDLVLDIVGLPST
ncbi:MAG TPA: hypothetical protein VK837_12885 [Longimicrobiales bacterium]|nr:hypothetical protein [Longimicrobiales bacterium]